VHQLEIAVGALDFEHAGAQTSVWKPARESIRTEQAPWTVVNSQQRVAPAIDWCCVCSKSTAKSLLQVETPFRHGGRRGCPTGPLLEQPPPCSAPADLV